MTKSEYVCANIKKKSVSVRPSVPWLDDNVVNARKLERKLERKYRRTQLTVDHQIWKTQARSVDRMFEIAKRDHFSINIENSSAAETFRTVNSLVYGKGVVILPSHECPAELADRFSTYFSDKVQSIRDRFPVLQTPGMDHSENYQVTSKLDRFSLVNEHELAKCIVAMRQTQCALDPIPTALLRKCLGDIIGLICSIVNSSLEIGVVPNSFKRAIVNPLIKKRSLDPDVLKNYRPVSNLSFLSKVLEKVVCNQLSRHLADNGILDKFQSAYRPCHSVETALLRVHNDIIGALDQQKCVLLVLLDMSAAFDTVDHERLCQRLSAIGVTGTALKWFSSYLSDRSQEVCVNGKFSTPSKIKYGVPQGSILGPVLFTVYTTSVGGIVRKFGIYYHLYADDSQLYIAFTIAEISATCSSITDVVDELNHWLVDNFLSCNGDKTDILLICSRRLSTSIDIPSIRIIDADVYVSQTVRNLGVIFDSEFSLKHHISSCVQATNFHIRNISKIRKYLSQNTTRLVVQALVTSRLDFCNSLLLGLPKSTIEPLQKVQNSAARLITKTRKLSSITPVLHSLHWLPVQQRIKYKVLLLTYKCLHGLAPAYLAELLTVHTPSRSLRSSSAPVLTVPRVRSTTIGGRAFSVGAPQLWNHLPASLRNSPSLDNFRRHLKHFLFET